MRRDALVELHWVIDPNSVSGAIHLRSDHGGHRITDSVVPTTGSRSLEVGSPMRWKLVEVRPEGERFLADLDLSVRE